MLFSMGIFVYGGNMKNRRVIVVVFIIVFASIFFCLRTNNEYNQINNFVNENSMELEEIAKNSLNNTLKDLKYKNVKIEGQYSGDHEIVQFLYNAVGIVPSSGYYGFYYSPDDKPATFQNVDFPLNAIGNDEWEWSEVGTDNRGKTIRIKECWYYYEAWF